MNVLRISGRKIVGKTIWTHKRKRTLENKNKQGDKGHIIRGTHCKIYKITPTTMVWSG
jgi:hypothetical protein